MRRSFLWVYLVETWLSFGWNYERQRNVNRCDFLFFFFFQAEDGIRVHCVTGVQTCALPISDRGRKRKGHRCPIGIPNGGLERRRARFPAPFDPSCRTESLADAGDDVGAWTVLVPGLAADRALEIGRASCRERA